MAKLAQLCQTLEELAPLSVQESYDNAGLLVGDTNIEVEGVLCTLDVTESVVEEAITKNCNVIVAHHPLIFSGLKKILNSHWDQRALIRAIKHDVAIYACHTNLDNVLIGGVNAVLADMLKLQHTKPIIAKHDDRVSIPLGSGMIGSLSRSLRTLEFLDFVKQTLAIPVLKHTTIVHESVSTIAVCGGSGRFLLEEAIAHNADILISSDFKYHDFFEANNQITIVDVGHYESERHTIKLLTDFIKNKFANFAVFSTKINTNPVKYY